MQNQSQPMMLWSAMGSTHLVIVLVSFFIASPASNPSLAPILLLPALLAAGSSLVLPNFFKGPPQAGLMVRWALAEAATLFGLVSFIFSGQHLYQMVCVAMGLAAWGAAIPTNPANRPN